jgi:hypothetical protein
MTNAPTTGSFAGCCARAANGHAGDEIASFQLIESHPIPVSRGGQDIEVQGLSQRAWGASDQAPKPSRPLQLAQARSDMRRIPRAGQE